MCKAHIDVCIAAYWTRWLFKAVGNDENGRDEQEKGEI
jgi:hypothetical protein